jgi:hypothetical protein
MIDMDPSVAMLTHGVRLLPLAAAAGAAARAGVHLATNAKVRPAAPTII